MRKGMPTGRMEEETKELLDYYHELYNWSYNDMVGRGSRQAILDEAKKCDIVCKSCHSNIHKPNYPFHK